MNKKIILKSSIALITASFLFSGCGTKYSKSFSTSCDPKQHTEQLCEKQGLPIIVTGVSNFSNMGFKHLEYTNSTAAALQAAAETTIKKGKKYFAIIKPAPVSAFNGSLINTGKEFMDKCSTSVADIFTFQEGKCGLHQKYRFIAQMEIIAFDSQQEEVVTYNAQEVIDYLKANKLYDEEGSIFKDPRPIN